MRASLKAIAEQAIVRSGVAALARRRRRGHVLVLAYHNVVPHGAPPAGDRSLHLPRAEFAAQLDALVETHDVLPLPEAIAAAGRPRARPVAAITFDDAYRGAVQEGIGELAARRLPATIFVAPGLLGAACWWDEVRAEGAAELDDATRSWALESLGGDGEVVRAQAPATGRRVLPVPPHAMCATEDELHAVLRTPGITLGAHTWRHPNLAHLADAALADEMTRPLAWLQERFGGAVVPMLAYPYGLEGRPVREAARQAGYAAAFRVDGGFIVPGDAPDPLRLPRYNVPAGLTTAGFALRIAGVLTR